MSASNHPDDSAAFPELSQLRVGVWGLGRLGANLAFQLARSGLSLRALVSRTPAKGEALAEECRKVGGGEAVGELLVTSQLDQAFYSCDLIFACLPDRLLGGVPGLLDGLPFRGRALIHTSGSTPSGIFGALRNTGASVGSFHPMQSFQHFSAEAANPFDGITVSVEGDAAITPQLLTLADKLGAEAMQIGSDPNQRANYHAAAVIASNALVALADLAGEVMARAGVEREAGARAIAKLMLGTATNLQCASPEQALTGPVARGDTETVAGHLAALRDAPELLSVYADLSARMLLLAERAGRIDSEQRARFVSLFLREMEEFSDP